MAFLGAITGGIVAVGFEKLSSSYLFSLSAATTAFLFTGAGNSLNDYYDRETDKVNHPERPIPSGIISPQKALNFSIALFFPTLLLSFLINLESFSIVLINLAIMFSYEVLFKKRGLRGNMVISWLVASLFLFGGFSVYGRDVLALRRIASLAILAFLATLGREIVKDIEDMKGDKDRRTLPKILGIKTAAYLASLSFLAAVLLSFAPFLLGILGYPYLLLVLLADAIFIYSAIFSFEKPKLVGKASKYAMLIALLAFLVGGI